MPDRAISGNCDDGDHYGCPGCSCTCHRPGGAGLDYAARCARYARQRGWAYDVRAMSIDRLTPAQRRRALSKERRSWGRG